MLEMIDAIKQYFKTKHTTFLSYLMTSIIKISITFLIFDLWKKMKYIPSRTLNLDTFNIFYFSNWSILKIFRSFIQILMKNVKIRPELTFFVIFYIKYTLKQKNKHF